MSIGSVVIVGPVGVRPMHLKAVCQQNVGHRHKYDHTTLQLHGESDVLISDGAEPVEQYRLKHLEVDPKNNAVFFSSGLRFERINLLAGERYLLSPGCPAAVPILQGVVELNGERFTAGRYLKVLSGKVSAEIVAVEPSQLMLVSVDPAAASREVTKFAGDAIHVAATRFHTVKAASDACDYACVYPHRDFKGVVVERFVNNQQAYDPE